MSTVTVDRAFLNDLIRSARTNGRHHAACSIDRKCECGSFFWVFKPGYREFACSKCGEPRVCNCGYFDLLDKCDAALEE